jgi:hypothetical protein
MVSQLVVARSEAGCGQKQLTIVQDITNAQKDAIGYALTASKTVMLCSAFSASMAPALFSAAAVFSE